MDKPSTPNPKSDIPAVQKPEIRGASVKRVGPRPTPPGGVPRAARGAHSYTFGEARRASWVGFRYLRSKKNSRFLSFITLISILGVTLGVAAMIVVLSVMDGFESELKKRLMSSDLHVLIEPTDQVAGFNQGHVTENSLDAVRIANLREKFPGITNWDPVLATEAILRAGRKVAGVSVKGVKPERMSRIREQASTREGMPYLPPGASAMANAETNPRGALVWIGQELSYELNVAIGDRIQMISPTEMEGPLGNVPRLRELQIEGIYHSGTPEQELHVIYAPMGTVRSFLKAADAISQWELSLKEFDDAPKIAEALRPDFPQFRVQDWIQMNSHLFGALRLERLAMFIMLAFIIVVASFNIVTTLSLMVIEKKREISILKTMGARDAQVGAIFLAEGLFIGGVGVGAGVWLAYFLCLALKRYQFIQLPDIYLDRNMPVTFDPMYYVGVALCAIVIVLFACLYPSRRAAALKPLDGIRFG